MISEYRKDFENMNGLLLQVGEKAQIQYLGKYSCELESKLSERDEQIEELECEGKPSLMKRIVKKNEMLLEQKKESKDRIAELKDWMNTALIDGIASDHADFGNELLQGMKK